MMSEKVTFQELVDSIAEQTKNTKQFTHNFLKDFVSVINEGLENDGTVNIAGFGKFKLKSVDERNGHNPQTGEKITIPSHNKVVFKPYKDLRELVNAPFAHLDAELLDESEEYIDSADEPDESRPLATNKDAPGTKSITDTESESTGQSDAAIVSEQSTESADEDEDPFGFSDSDHPKQSSLNTDDLRTDDVTHDIVEYSPYQETGDQAEEDQQTDVDDHSSDTMLVDLPVMQKSKIPEPQNSKDESASEFFPAAFDETEQTSSESPAPAEDSNLMPEASETVEDLFEVTNTSEPVTSESEEDGEQQPADHLTPDDAPSDSEVEIPVHVGQNKKSSFRYVAVAAVLLIAAAGLWYVFMPRSVVFKNVSGMITQIADRQWYQPATSILRDVSTLPKSEQQQPVVRKQSDRQTLSMAVKIPKGQTLWSLADQEYDDPYLWPWIYGRNKTSINNPDKVLAGQVLSVPIPSGKQRKLNNRDSLGVALGYVETYHWYKTNNYDKAKYYLYAAKTYRGNVVDHTDVSIDKADLAFANRAR